MTWDNSGHENDVVRETMAKKDDLPEGRCAWCEADLTLPENQLHSTDKCYLFITGKGGRP